MLSNKFIDTVNCLFDMKKKMTNRNLYGQYEELQAVNCLWLDFKENLYVDINPIKNSINDGLFSENRSHYNTFINGINNGCLSSLCFGRSKMTTSHKNQLLQLNCMSQPIKNFISTMCDSILYTNSIPIYLKSQRIYFCKLLIPVFFAWKNSMKPTASKRALNKSTRESIRQVCSSQLNILQFNRLTKKYGITFDQSSQFHQYYHQIKTKIFIYENKTDAIELIKILQQFYTSPTK